MDSRSSDAAESLALRSLAALDLTSLNESDNLDRIEALCDSARTPFGAPAALCVYPEWVATCRERLTRFGLPSVHIASVVNFPDGANDLERAVRETQRAIAAGADEIDVVFPYRAFLAGELQVGPDLVRACKSACAQRARLKVILETGVLGHPDTIRRAAELALQAGADFLKTSTGKVPVNATLPAARVMLEAIREHGGRCGFKAAGGVRTLAEAAAYFALADDLLGAQWATAERFRLGASGLLAEILALLRDRELQRATSPSTPTLR